ncbi:phage major capsid protein [Enterococcus thailandicus]|uniref:phage major capsid family protein n=1 Tax=Enterococcus thailandicus TaxID=417368 RepID=UPI0022E2B714|nr:phage major capsid protein [Enterococcus thailandicus]MDK4353352.1 phage major capsid protein [Enterococcus thailandicus]
MTLTITNKTADAKKAFNAVSNQEGATPEQINTALEEYVTAIAEDAGKQVRSEYEELKNVTDNQILQARGIPVLTAEETKFYNEVSKKGGFDEDLTWPETIFERVFEDIQKEHPILRLINFTPTVGLTKTIRSRRKGVAVFGPLHKDIEGQLDAEFGVTETHQLALTAFFLISKDTLKLGARWINRYVRLCLGEAVKDIWAEKVVTGSGKDEPVGLLKNVEGALDPTTGLPDKDPAGTLTFKDSKTIVAEMGALMKKMSRYIKKIGDNDENDEEESRKIKGRINLIINPVDYWDIMTRITTQNSNGAFVTNLPFISEDRIIESEDVPEGKLIAFVSGEYDATQSQPEKVYEYHETFAMKRAVLYAIDMLGNGEPANNYSAQVYNLSLTAGE